MDFEFTNFITGVVSGLMSSVAISFLIWISQPRVKVSKKIAEENGKYRCKIQNNSNRDIGDTHIRVTYRTTVDGTNTYTTYLPMLHSKKASKNSCFNEARLLFRKAVWKSPIEGMDDRIELSMKEFFTRYNDDCHCCVELEVSYYDYNLIFGAVRRYETQIYTKDSIENDSVFPKGSLKPVSVQKKLSQKKKHKNGHHPKARLLL